jgi:hypothetical protein
MCWIEKSTKSVKIAHSRKKTTHRRYKSGPYFSKQSVTFL